MDIQLIKELIAAVDSSNISEITIKEGNLEISLSRSPKPVEAPKKPPVPKMPEGSPEEELLEELIEESVSVTVQGSPEAPSPDEIFGHGPAGKGAPNGPDVLDDAAIAFDPDDSTVVRVIGPIDLSE